MIPWRILEPNIWCLEKWLFFTMEFWFLFNREMTKWTQGTKRTTFLDKFLKRKLEIYNLVWIFLHRIAKKKKIWFLNVWCGNVRLVVVDLLVCYYFPILVDFNWKSFKNEISNVMDTLEGANRSSGSFFFVKPQ